MIEANPDLVLTSPALERACAIAGASRALSQAIARRPGLLVGSAPDDSVPLRLRAALATIAGDDLAGVIEMRAATTRFSDAIDDLVRDVLSRTTAAIAERHPLVADLPFAVIAMGKWGARELNYSSDIDLLFVHDRSGA